MMRVPLPSDMVGLRITPPDINYVFLTFCAADRAKQIKTKAIVNEDPTEALIRELKEENERLKSRMKSGDVDEQELKDMAGKEVMSKDELAAMKKAWLEEMKANMKSNEKARNSLQIRLGDLCIQGRAIVS